MPLFFESTLLLFYFVISLGLLFLSFISILIKNKQLDFLSFLLICIMMTCFYGLRPSGTVDTKMYLDIFKQLAGFANFPYGVGFYILMKSIKYIDNTNTGYVFYSSLFIVLFFALAVFLLCKNMYYKSLCMISLFFSWSMLDLSANTYRQGVAVPFFLLSVYFYKERKFFWFASCIIISLSMHWGATLILLLFLIAMFFSRKIKVLKLISISALALLTVSFFINFNFSELAASSPLINQLQTVFVGIDLLSKINSYLGGAVDGANFYEMTSLQRIYFTGEIYIALIVCVIFFITRKVNDPIMLSNSFMTAYSFFILVSLYGIVLISMTWFIRNFYWVVPTIPILYMYILKYIEDNKKKSHLPILSFYCIFLIAFSCDTFWRAPIITVSYL